MAQNTRPVVSSLGRKLIKATNYNLRQLRAEVVRLKEERCYVTLKGMKDREVNIDVFGGWKTPDRILRKTEELEGEHMSHHLEE